MIEKSNLKPTGRLTYNVFRDGQLIESVSDENLVVSGFNDVVAKLIGGIVGAQPVNLLGVGTNNTAPAPGNSTLTGLSTKGIDSVSQPAPGQIQYNFTIATTDFNGINIGEFGLFTASNILVARRVRLAPLPKTSSISISGYWIIII